MINEWAEDLPDKCPPEKAYPPQDEILYRLVDTFPPVESDFFSVHKIDPQRPLRTTDECHAKACSLYDTLEGCSRQKRYRPFRNKIVVGIILTPDSGLIQQTQSPGHYSWWRKAAFDCVANCVDTPGEINDTE